MMIEDLRCFGWKLTGLKIDLGGTDAKTYEGLIKLFLDVFSYSAIKKL